MNSFQNAKVNELEDKLFQTLQKRKRDLLLNEVKQTIKPIFQSPAIFKQKRTEEVPKESYIIKDNIPEQNRKILHRFEKSNSRLLEAGKGEVETKEIVFKVEKLSLHSEKSPRAVRYRRPVSKIPSIITFDDSGFEFLDEDELIEPDSIISNTSGLPPIQDSDDSVYRDEPAGRKYIQDQNLEMITQSEERKKRKRKKKKKKDRGPSLYYGKLGEEVENIFDIKKPPQKPGSLSDSLTELSSADSSDPPLENKHIAPSGDRLVALTNLCNGTPTKSVMTPVTESSERKKEKPNSLTTADASLTFGFDIRRQNKRDPSLQHPKQTSLGNRQKKREKPRHCQSSRRGGTFTEESDKTRDNSPSLSSHFEKMRSTSSKPYDLKSITSIKNKWDSYCENGEKSNTKILEAELEKIKCTLKARKYNQSTSSHSTHT